MSLSTPSKIAVPFANGGSKNSIPVLSQTGTVPNGASYTDGFPALTMTIKSAGGLPPRGQDMNGILYDITNTLRYTQAGGLYPYDLTFAGTVGGYPQGSMVQASDGTGAWLNTVANNTSNPESFGAGWLPFNQVGGSAITLSNTNVTLTALQAGKSIIILTGAISSNLNLVFPTWVNEWTIINNTTGGFTVTAKTALGSGVILNSGENKVCGDGTNIIGIGLFGILWTDVTSSRATATNYTNTTGKYIQVCITFGDTGGTSTATAEIDGVTIFSNTYDYGTSYSTFVAQLVVPPNSVYKFTNAHIVKWVELR